MGRAARERGQFGDKRAGQISRDPSTRNSASNSRQATAPRSAASHKQAICC